ncbi:PEP-CTERM sorting domain-containing protein [Candidatus Uabimicrobium amorphum]|uniref:PEP-CTERM protein-sorting domain-containing protein n=1 Tax=Uabimicrobium amorphum TaxID=2596890 RepID=A0A5S9II48_UABAM|nr:PEP-CTERM sorting domain-containing protein [Candidatus Uabimicrobium amorphum]BBM81896.1 hypothetical protein UABAM_00238 [Candidatus Uabimicrobium amorphum]
MLLRLFFIAMLMSSIVMAETITFNGRTGNILDLQTNVDLTEGSFTFREISGSASFIESNGNLNTASFDDDILGFNSDGTQVEFFATSGSFFNALDVRVGAISNGDFTFTGFRNGQQVASQNIAGVSPSNTLVNLAGFTNLDLLLVTAVDNAVPDGFFLPIIDDLQLQTVPEPTTYIALLLGMVFLIRRSKK